VLGVSIHAGEGSPELNEKFYAIDGNELDVDVVPNPPGDIASNNEVDSADASIPYDHIFPLGA
jgi:hypothetical protein